MSNDDILKFKKPKFEYEKPTCPFRKKKSDTVFEMALSFWPNVYLEEEHPKVYSILMGDIKLNGTKTGHEIKKQYDPPEAADLTRNSYADFGILDLVAVAELTDRSCLVYDVRRKVFLRYTNDFFARYRKEVENQNQELWNKFQKFMSANVKQVMAKERKWEEGVEIERSLKRPPLLGPSTVELEIVEVF
ncbi:MAG: hypothetical protein FWD89_01235 [Firmicutes bacterium]|nr:hypothetical protein [Bacillota bacterium]